MNCPRDKSQLTPKQTNGIQYHVCDVCHGILITKKDLDQFHHRTLILELPSTQKSPVTIVEGEAISPLVDKPMEVIKYKGVNIDVCRATGHIWLDGGELDLIIKKMRTKGLKAGVLEGATYTVDAVTSPPTEELIDGAGQVIGHIFEFISDGIGSL